MTLKRDMGFLFFFIRSAMGKVSDGQIMAKLASRSCSHKRDYKKKSYHNGRWLSNVLFADNKQFMSIS